MEAIKFGNMHASTDSMCQVAQCQAKSWKSRVGRSNLPYSSVTSSSLMIAEEYSICTIWRVDPVLSQTIPPPKKTQKNLFEYVL